MDCLWFSVFCSVHLGHDIKLWLIRALYAESLYWFFFGPSPSCNSRLKKIMQLCSCLDQSSKEDESSSAKTFYHWTPKDPARAFMLVLLITLHLSNSPLHSSSWDLAATWAPWAMWQSNSLGPWSQGTLGFRSVTTEVPQRLPISRLMSSKDFRVTPETGDTLLKTTPVHYFEAEHIKYMVCWDL